MRRWLLLVLILLVCGCGDVTWQIQARTADSIAAGANAVLPMLIERYRQDGFRAIDAVKKGGGTAQDARRAVARVQHHWAPIWRAWKSLQIAQNQWASVVEARGNTASPLEALKNAYCELQKVWPADIPAVPLVPVRCSP